MFDLSSKQELFLIGLRIQVLFLTLLNVLGIFSREKSVNSLSTNSYSIIQEAIL